MQNPPPLNDLLASAAFHRLSVVKSGDGWQANLQRDKGDHAFRVEHGATAAEAIAALFEPVPVYLPPCPIPLPACPVALP